MDTLAGIAHDLTDARIRIPRRPTTLPGRTLSELERAAGGKLRGYPDIHRIARQLDLLGTGSQALVVAVHNTPNANGISAHAYRMILDEDGLVVIQDTADPTHILPGQRTAASVHAILYTPTGSIGRPLRLRDEIAPKFPRNTRIGGREDGNSDEGESAETTHNTPEQPAATPAGSTNAAHDDILPTVPAHDPNASAEPGHQQTPRTGSPAHDDASRAGETRPAASDDNPAYFQETGPHCERFETFEPEDFQRAFADTDYEPGTRIYGFGPRGMFRLTATADGYARRDQSTDMTIHDGPVHTPQAAREFVGSLVRDKHITTIAVRSPGSARTGQATQLTNTDLAQRLRQGNDFLTGTQFRFTNGGAARVLPNGDIEMRPAGRTAAQTVTVTRADFASRLIERGRTFPVGIARPVPPHWRRVHGAEQDPVITTLSAVYNAQPARIRDHVAGSLEADLNVQRAAGLAPGSGQFVEHVNSDVIEAARSVHRAALHRLRQAPESDDAGLRENATRFETMTAGMRADQVQQVINALRAGNTTDSYVRGHDDVEFPLFAAATLTQTNIVVMHGGRVLDQFLPAPGRPVIFLRRNDDGSYDIGTTEPQGGGWYMGSIPTPAVHAPATTPPLTTHPTAAQPTTATSRSTPTGMAHHGIGYLGADGARVFDTDAAGLNFGETVLNSWHELTSRQQRAVQAYDQMPIANTLLRRGEEQMQQYLDRFHHRAAALDLLTRLTGPERPSITTLAQLHSAGEDSLHDTIADPDRRTRTWQLLRVIFENRNPEGLLNQIFADADFHVHIRAHFQRYFGTEPRVGTILHEISLLDEATQRRLPIAEDLRVVRGLENIGFMRDPNGNRLEDNDPSLLEGTVQTEPGYLSTSVSRDLVTIPGGRRYNYRLNLTVPIGGRGLWVGLLGFPRLIPNVAELLLARGTRYHITTVTRDQTTGMVVLEARVLPPAETSRTTAAPHSTEYERTPEPAPTYTIDTERWRPLRADQADPGLEDAFVLRPPPGSADGPPTVSRGRRSGIRQVVRYDLTPGPDEWKFRLRVHLKAGAGATESTLIEIIEKTAIANQGINQDIDEFGMTLPGTGAKMSSSVEFVDDPSNAHLVVEALPGLPREDLPMSQRRWFAGEPPKKFKHEILHSYGPQDAYRLPRGLLRPIDPRAEAQSGDVMGELSDADGPYTVLDDHLAQIVEVAAPFLPPRPDVPRPARQRPEGRQPTSDQAQDEFDLPPEVNPDLLVPDDRDRVVETETGILVYHTTEIEPADAFEQGIPPKNPANRQSIRGPDLRGAGTQLHIQLGEGGHFHRSHPSRGHRRGFRPADRADHFEPSLPAEGRVTQRTYHGAAGVAASAYQLIRRPSTRHAPGSTSAVRIDDLGQCGMASIMARAPWRRRSEPTKNPRACGSSGTPQ